MKGAVVVLYVIVLAALAAGFWFYLKNKETIDKAKVTSGKYEKAQPFVDSLLDIAGEFKSGGFRGKKSM